MSELRALHNVGKVLEGHLLRVGIETPEQLRSIGAEVAFIRIRKQVDSCACLHMLYGIQGAIDNMPDKVLPDNTKKKLRQFYETL